MAVALAVLIAGSTVEPSALKVAAAGQKQAAVTTGQSQIRHPAGNTELQRCRGRAVLQVMWSV